MQVRLMLEQRSSVSAQSEGAQQVSKVMTVSTGIIFSALATMNISPRYFCQEYATGVH